MGKIFETDGFRGEANVQLTADNAFHETLCRLHMDDHTRKIVIKKILQTKQLYV